MKKTETLEPRRILGRRLARELTRDELVQAAGQGTATTTLISPPDEDCI